MPLLKDLVPGSKSDRLSFISESESYVSSRRTTPGPRSTSGSRSRSRDNPLRKTRPNSWTSVSNSESESITTLGDSEKMADADNQPRRPQRLARSKSRENITDGSSKPGISRGVTCAGATLWDIAPGSKSQENTVQKTRPNSWTSIDISEDATEKNQGKKKKVSWISLIFNCIGLLINRLNPFSKSGSGLPEVVDDHNRRVVTKTGQVNTIREGRDRDCSVILKDLFISAIHLSWYWTILNFFASFVLSWAFFAIIWYFLALIHGDFVPVKERPKGHIVCVENVDDFTTAFLFSVETQHTIGYGGRQTTSECSTAVILMCLQSIIGVFIDACMTGIVFAKFTKPTHRAKTILFSKNALITMRNGAFYLLCRVGDLRPTHLIESHISGYILKKEVTEEGEEIPNHLYAIEFGTDLDGTQDFFQLFWPIVLSHRIDENSPLWGLSPKDLETEKLEIVLTMEGTTPETGNNIQVRTSYLPCEILWGYKFQHSCVDIDPTTGKYRVTFDTLNTIVKDNTPRMSPQNYDEEKKRESEETNSMCSQCSHTSSIQPISAIPKAFFGKARTKNKVHKLPE